MLKKKTLSALYLLDYINRFYVCIPNIPQMEQNTLKQKKQQQQNRKNMKIAPISLQRKIHQNYNQN